VNGFPREHLDELPCSGLAQPVSQVFKEDVRQYCATYLSVRSRRSSMTDRFHLGELDRLRGVLSAETRTAIEIVVRILEER
jgi:hypothetical protein